MKVRTFQCTDVPEPTLQRFMIHACEPETRTCFNQARGKSEDNEKQIWEKLRAAKNNSCRYLQSIGNSRNIFQNYVSRPNIGTDFMRHCFIILSEVPAQAAYIAK